MTANILIQEAFTVWDFILNFVQCKKCKLYWRKIHSPRMDTITGTWKQLKTDDYIDYTFSESKPICSAILDTANNNIVMRIVYNHSIESELAHIEEERLELCDEHTWILQDIIKRFRTK